MELSELKKDLQQAGFKIVDNPYRHDGNLCNWYAYRASKLQARECESNEGKAAQIIVTPFELFHTGSKKISSAEVTLTRQFNNTWWKQQAYGIALNQLIEKLPAVEEQLIRAWNALETKEKQS